MPSPTPRPRNTAACCLPAARQDHPAAEPGSCAAVRGRPYSSVHSLFFRPSAAFPATTRHAARGAGAGGRAKRARSHRSPRAAGRWRTDMRLRRDVSEASRPTAARTKAEGWAAQVNASVHDRLCIRKVSARPAAAGRPLFLTWIGRNIAGKRRFQHCNVDGQT